MKMVGYHPRLFKILVMKFISYSFLIKFNMYS